MKRRIVGLLLALNMVCLAGCTAANSGGQGSLAQGESTQQAALEASADSSANASDSSAAASTQSAGSTSIYEKEWYKEAIKSGLLSTGTNGRLENFVNKLRNGEKVTIAMIGGSITEGGGVKDTTKSYCDQFITMLGEQYPDAEIEYVNAGVGGTPSALGIMRYDKDVTSLCSETPDLVVVEFAVNDYEEPTEGRAYESLVRQILEEDDETAVMLMFAVFKSKWNLEDLYIPVGNLYGLPMVSVKDGTAAAFESGDLSDSLYFSDEYHPTALGHKIMADTMMNLINEIDSKIKTKTATDKIAPVPETYYYSPDFLNMKLVTSKDSNGAKVSTGSFTLTDTEVHQSVRSDEVTFPDNWSRDVSGNEPFVLEANCKNILLDYKAANNSEYGEAEVYVDGELMLTIDANRADGWNNNNVEIAFDDSKVSSHKLEIKMAEGSEDKKFTILAIAYSDEEMNLTQDRSAKAAASELAGTTMLDVYKDSFKLGVALPNNVFNSMTDFDTTVKDNFNSITCENEMKPESLLDKEASASGLPDSYYEPAVHFDNCQPSINYCEENGIQMRLHTLVWHNQTPRWFFTEDYTDDGDLVDRETMLRRMESYIKSVLTYFDKEHPGLIYAVDVVNEAFDVGDGDENGIRQKNNLWYEVVGPDYYVRAFEYASKYASDDYSLFYNDYSCMWKGDLILENLSEVKENGWIDGIGMQSHLSTSDDIDKFLETAKSFLDAGYEVQGTELDIGVKSSTNAEFQKQADLYKAYFEGMLELKNQGYNVTSITVWGIDDAHTWRSGEDPLLFDKDLKKKDAYYAIIEDYES